MIKVFPFDKGLASPPSPDKNFLSLFLELLISGELQTDPKLKTICIYGHLDVQPAEKIDGWDTEPFELIEKNGKLYGRGSTDDKVV